MLGEKDFETPVSGSGSLLNDAGFGMLRIVLLFGSAVVALALILIPAIEGIGNSGQLRAGNPGIDRISTGSIGYANRYTIRRSVLQKNPAAVCVIREDGSRTGDCG